MDNINFASTSSTFNNPADLYVLSPTKEEMDARKDLDVYRRNGTEEQNRKKSLQEISSATQEKQLSFQQSQSFKRCIWCINFILNQKKKVPTCCNQKKEQSIPSSSGPEWRYDPISINMNVPISINMNVRELCEDECLNYFMSVQTRSSNQISNSISSDKSAIQKLPSLSELVEAVKNDHKYREFHEHKDKWLIDQEYFSDIYGITNVHPLLVDSYGANLMFLDNRGILFAWCAITESIFIFGINIMEGLANFLYHPEKKFIIETNGEMILHVELEHQAIEELVAAKLI